MFVIVKKFLIPKGYSGLTVFPFIILSKKTDITNQIMLNHEKIHIKQQIELLILPFFVWYFVDFLIQFVKFGNINQAYRNIIFEKEAYQNEHNLNYLKTRKFFGFLRKN